MAAAITVDAREAALLALLPEARSAALGTGDVLIGEGAIVIERKRADDLGASIRDGRWRDQLARMAASGGRPLLVVEGLPPGDGSAGGLPCAALRSALCGALVRDGVPFLASDGPEDTAAWVRRLADRAGRREGPSSQSPVTAAGVRLPARGAALSQPRVVARAQLCCVPGVSPAVADAVLGECESLGDWIRLWEGRERELAETRLRSRRLGGVLAGRIMRALGASGTPPP